MFQICIITLRSVSASCWLLLTHLFTVLGANSKAAELLSLSYVVGAMVVAQSPQADRWSTASHGITCAVFTNSYFN